jgi:hypothetical protein
MNDLSMHVIPPDWQVNHPVGHNLKKEEIDVIVK